MVAPRSTMEICKLLKCWGELDVLVIWDEMDLLRIGKLNKHASKFKDKCLFHAAVQIYPCRLYTVPVRNGSTWECNPSEPSMQNFSPRRWPHCATRHKRGLR